MTYVSDSNLKEIHTLNKRIDELTDNLIFTTPVNDLNPIYNNLGSRNAAHGVQTGLESIQPITHLITDVDDGGTATGVFDRINVIASNVLVDRSGFTALNLKWIQKTANNGQRIASLTVKSGKTLTLKTGGNLAISADIVMSDQDIAYLVYSADITNKYRVLVASGGGGGANVFLSNLVSPTAINQDLLPNTDGTRDLGDGTHYWDDIYVEQVRFKATGGIVVTNIPMITSSATGSLILNFFTGDDVEIQENGVAKWNINASQLSGANITLSNLFTLNDNLADPSSNGQFARNATHVKVFSGGAVRNLSDIAVGGGANTFLSNLSSPTAINQDLIPGTSGDKNLGSAALEWNRLFTEAVEFVVGGTLSGGVVNMTGNASDLFINVPTGGNIEINENAVARIVLDFGTNSLDLDNVDVILSNTGVLTLEGSGGVPDTLQLFALTGLPAEIVATHSLDMKKGSTTMFQLLNDATIKVPVYGRYYVNQETIGDGAIVRWVSSNYGDTNAVATAGLQGRRARNTLASPMAVQSLDVLIRIAAQGWDTTGFFTGGLFEFFANETWSTTARGTFGRISTTPNASITNTEVMRWGNNGDVGIASLKKFFLDGVALTGDTYISEGAANEIDLVAGGVFNFILTATEILAGVKLDMGAKVIENVGPTITGSVTTNFLLQDTAGWIYNCGTGDSHIWTINELGEMQLLDGKLLLLGGNSLAFDAAGTIVAGNYEIRRTSGGLEFNVPTGAVVATLKINGVTEYRFNSIDADFEGNNLADVGHVYPSFANANDLGGTGAGQAPFRDLYADKFRFGTSSNYLGGSSTLCEVSLGTGDTFYVFAGSTAELVITTDSIQIGSQTTDDVGFMGTTPIPKQTGVAVTAAAIHAALVNLGLISA